MFEISLVIMSWNSLVESLFSFQGTSGLRATKLRSSLSHSRFLTYKL
jgi:hypothetical protein